jgi:hypothetical protein
MALAAAVLWCGLGYFSVFGVAYLATRRGASFVDPLILPCVAFLNGLGLVMIYRIDLAQADAASQRSAVFSPEAPKQVLWTTIASALFLAVLIVVKDQREILPGPPHAKLPDACSGQTRLIGSRGGGAVE